MSTIIHGSMIMRHWYLVHTKPRKERVAEQNLQRQGYDFYLPLIQQPRRRRGQWIEVIEPLFPRYLFVRLRVGYDDIRPIHYTTGVHNLVCFTEEPAIVPDQIIESLRRTADPSTGLHHPKSPMFKPGDTVVVDKSPLAGLQAIFLAETAQDRVIVLLKILGRENRITVERDMLRLA
jgi:transcriptional antiterminator RfaH